MKTTNISIKYPIFLKCCIYLTDPFWIYLFEDFAYSKCPFGIIIQDNNYIYSIQKNKEFSYFFGNKDPETIVSELSDLLSTRLNILSQKDHFSQRNRYVSYYQSFIDNITSWNEIKRKKFKDLLLEQYVLEIRQTYNYSWSLTHQIYSILLIGIQFKIILPKHIHYKNGKILRIDGLIFNSDHFISLHNVFIYGCQTDNNLKKNKNHQTTPQHLSLYWKRYLYSL